jgi:cell division septation protein DedD
MSMQDNGPGPGPGDSTRGRNPGSESDFASSQSADYAPEIWGNNALNAQKSEVTLMANGAGRPGQPAGGQRPMFGGGSPVFAQMPTYKPVTRGSDFAPQAPEPPQPAFNPYTAPSQPSQNAGSGLSYPSPQSPSPLSYPSPHPSAAPSYQSPHPTAAPSYQSSQPASAPNYHNPHAAPAPSYQASEFQPQNYHPAAQPVRAPSFSGADYAGSQSYASAGYNGAQGFPNQNFHDQNFADANFPESGQSDASFPESIFDRNFADPNYGNQNFGQQADASFPESFDGKLADASFPPTPAFEPHDHFGQGGAAGYGQPDGQADHGYENFADEHAHDYGAHGMDSGQVPPSDPRRQLQAFDAIYDQPPQIALGSTEPARRPAQDFYEGERVDADFLDEGQVVPPPNARGKMTLRSRSAFMVGSALLGAIALGGALAFAYKQSGGGLSSEQPPIVQADNSPVKELPDDLGGKDFPHKNKLIYDRLQNGDEPESERLVPRQENVAVPALPPSTETAGMPMPVATTDLATPTTQATGGEPVAVASVDNGSMPDGGPRKVKTMVVRPDGSVSGPPADAPAAEAAAPAPQEAAPAPEAAQAAPQQVASVQGAAPAPKPAAKPAAQQTAAATPKPAAAPASSKYVVQVGSKKNQTDALASFADMQQKYPTLLANYRPMVQKADLGTKGTWYRLRIGPIADKTAASKLCTQLKSQGLPDCLVMAQ